MSLGSEWRKSSRSTPNGACLEARWAKSSYSGTGNCLEAAFRKSSYSNLNGSCAEAALRDGVVLVRDSKLGGASPVLAFAPEVWRVFLGSVKAGSLTARHQ